MAPGAERPELNYGSKIILPPSALDKVSKLHVQWPLLMEMINGEKDRYTHAGVLEFVAEEGRAYLPQWVSHTLRQWPLHAFGRRVLQGEPTDALR
jgi:ubiquitin fusion degradation protein 1